VLILPEPGHKGLERWEEFDEGDTNLDFVTNRLSDFLRAVV
jgi:hypothetical protein